MSVKAKARRADPEQSWLAANEVDVTPVQYRVLAILFKKGPLTDDQIVSEYGADYPLPEQAASPQSIRSRRSELVRLGYVQYSGVDGLTLFRRRSRMWEVA